LLNLTQLENKSIFFTCHIDHAEWAYVEAHHGHGGEPAGGAIPACFLLEIKVEIMHHAEGFDCAFNLWFKNSLTGGWSVSWWNKTRVYYKEIKVEIMHHAKGFDCENKKELTSVGLNY
ncbi:hypothetical protein ACJX0J_022246, partial [Zea mays]